MKLHMKILHDCLYMKYRTVIMKARVTDVFFFFPLNQLLKNIKCQKALKRFSLFLCGSEKQMFFKRLMLQC